MSRKGKTPKMIEQILEMKANGVGVKSMARSLGISKNTVKKYLKKSGEADGIVQAGSNWRDSINWESVTGSYRRGKTIKQLHEDHAPDGVSYWSFNRHLNTLVDIPKEVSLSLHHTPGETTQIDYSGGIKIIDPKSGKTRKTWLFCGVLPFSSRTFAEFVLTQNQTSLFKSKERMWGYFGGVTPYVVLDNMKTGVTKAHQFDPDINTTYVDFCNHYKVAPLPARPFAPKDKASVEAAIGVIKRTFYSKVKEKKYYSLEELNSDFRQFLDELNHKPMKDYGVSRMERFEEERSLLLDLPSEPFEIYEFKSAKVHPDCCIQTSHNLYSVPWKYSGQTVKVKISSNLIEIFSGDSELLATHIKLEGKHKRSIKEDHLPTSQFQRNKFEVKKCLAFAESVGPKTFEMIEEQFSGDRPLFRLRRVQGILRLAKDPFIGKEALEFASSQAITFNKVRVDFIKNTAISWQRSRNQSGSKAPKRDASTLFLHNT